MIILQARKILHHKQLVFIARQSPYTKDFSNEVMFSSDTAYARGWVRLAMMNDVIIGFTCVRVKKQTARTKLYFMGVMPDCQRQGVATRLVESLQKWLINEHYTHQTIELSCKRDNIIARQLYLKLGFVIEHSDLDYNYMLRIAPCTTSQT
jgi:ribosomal protein S18 acetylase RimI-like enzyme